MEEEKDETKRDEGGESKRKAESEAGQNQPQRRPRNFRQFIDRFIGSVPDVK